MTAIEPAATGEPPAETTHTSGGDAPDTAEVLAAGDVAAFVTDYEIVGRPANPVEINLPRHPLEVYFDAKVVDSNGVPPGTIISVQDDFYLEWHIWAKGPLLHLICGCWCVDLRVESIGEGEEFSLSRKIGKGCGFRCCFHGCHHDTHYDDPSYARPYHSPDHCHHFCCKVCVPACTIPASKCSTVYLLAATFQLLDHCGHPAPIVGYKDMGAFSFYDPS